jgi:DMSO/TMAO reductase YedYZ molybdopterin-dependent catalytic subunit
MSNALWTGVRLKDVLDRADVKPAATAVRFGGLGDADREPSLMWSFPDEGLPVQRALKCGSCANLSRRKNYGERTEG